MNRVVPYIVVLIVVVMISIVGVSNCVPNQVESKPVDPISCSCSPGGGSLISLGSGVITDIKYIKDGNKDYIKFNIDGVPVTLDFGRTKTADYSEIYPEGNIQEGQFYYIYEWGGDRIVWSRTPKTVSGTGELIDLQK
jgi:hypothetical protein